MSVFISKQQNVWSFTYKELGAFFLGVVVIFDTPDTQGKSSLFSVSPRTTLFRFPSTRLSKQQIRNKIYLNWIFL
jgi:hypothetical protein